MRVSLSNVRVAVATGPGVEAGMMTLREDAPPHRSLSIVIGQPEARAILAAWTGTVPSRPSTWDLFVATVAALEGRLQRVTITAVEDKRHFFADLELEHDGQRAVCRPGRPTPSPSPSRLPGGDVCGGGRIRQARCLPGV